MPSSDSRGIADIFGNVPQPQHNIVIDSSRSGPIIVPMKSCYEHGRGIDISSRRCFCTSDPFRTLLTAYKKCVYINRIEKRERTYARTESLTTHLCIAVSMCINTFV